MKFEVTILLRTHEPIDINKLPALLYEQWEQTPAHAEGDAILVISAKEID